MNILQTLLERADPAIQDQNIVDCRPYIDKICKLVFMTGGDWLSDAKRGPERKFYGVANKKSVIFDKKGEHLFLTLDNSTDSGEFELNSLSRLMIVAGSHLDQELQKLYKELNIKSKRKLGYTERNGKRVVRDVCLGRVIDDVTIHFVLRVMGLLTGTAKPQA